MIRRPEMVGLDGGAAPSTAPARLLAVSDDETLAGRARAARERDGLVVHIEAAGTAAAEVAGIYARRPTVVRVRRAAGRPGLEDLLEWARRDVPGAPVLVVLPPVRADDLGR